MEGLRKTENEPSPERKRELIDAKNNLKEIVENIDPEELKAMNAGIDPLDYFIRGCGGDVNRYVNLSVKAESGNPPDVAAWHVIENLVRIKEALESK
jgi:hypothetical protein